MPVFPMPCDAPRTRSRPRPAGRWAATCVVLLAWTAVEEMPAGERLLRQAGLRRWEGSQVWLLEDEFQMQALLGELDPVHRRIVRLQSELTEKTMENQLLWQATRQQSEVLRQKLAQAPTGDLQRPQWERQLRQLESQGVDPAKLSSVAPVRSLLVQLTDLRLRLALSVITIRRLHQQMLSEYELLAKNPGITRALRARGENHRLGPLRKGYEFQLKRLERHEGLAFSHWVPLYQQSDRTRFGGIVHERVPAVFTWQDSSQETLIPATLVESAGLTFLEDAETVEISLESQRRLQTRRVVLPTLRFGGVVLRDVSALMLPPEGEDIGPRIGPAGLSGYMVELEPERLRARFQPL